MVKLRIQDGLSVGCVQCLVCVVLSLHWSLCPRAIGFTVGRGAFRLLNNSLITNHCTEIRPNAPVSYFVLLLTWYWWYCASEDLPSCLVYPFAPSKPWALFCHYFPHPLPSDSCVKGMRYLSCTACWSADFCLEFLPFECLLLLIHYLPNSVQMHLIGEHLKQ